MGSDRVPDDRTALKRQAGWSAGDRLMGSCSSSEDLDLYIRSKGCPPESLYLTFISLVQRLIHAKQML